MTHWPDLEAALQGRPVWRRVGRDYHGPCPVSGAGRDCCFASEGRAGGVAVGCRRCGNGGRLDSESLIAHLAALGGETARHVAAYATNDRAAIETPSPLPARAWGGTPAGRRAYASARGAVGLSYDIYRPWRLSLPCCFLAGEVFPPFHRHIDVGRLDIERVDAPPLLLKCRQGPSCRPLPLTVRRRALRPALNRRRAWPETGRRRRPGRRWRARGPPRRSRRGRRRAGRR